VPQTHPKRSVSSAVGKQQDVATPQAARGWAFQTLLDEPTPRLSPALPQQPTRVSLSNLTLHLVVAEQVEEQLEHFDVKELSRLVWALAVLEQLDMHLLQAMAARVQV
jgi:hypothetical protein